MRQASKPTRQRLRSNPNYRYAQAGVARVQAAQGDVKGAIAAYEKLVNTLPLPEFVIQLGELYEVNGDTAAAQKQYDLVRTMQTLNQSAGMDVDLELALFEADHGTDHEAALALARAAYAKRPTVYGADVLRGRCIRQENRRGATMERQSVDAWHPGRTAVFPCWHDRLCQ